MTQAVNASRKIAGRHVSVDEHPGKGTVINVDDTSARRGGGGGGGLGACCGPDGICYETDRATCETDGGIFHEGTTCDDPEIDCSGACCLPDTSCIDGVDITECTESGGTFQGPETTCDDPEVDCELPDCACGFDAFDGSGRKFLTRTTVTSVDQEVDCDACPDFGNPTDIGNWTCTDTYDPDTCDLTSDVSGSETATYCDGTIIHPGERCDCFGDVVSATVTHYHLDAPDPPCTPTFIIDVVCTLSNECNPI